MGIYNRTRLELIQNKNKSYQEWKYVSGHQHLMFLSMILLLMPASRDLHPRHLNADDSYLPGSPFYGFWFNIGSWKHLLRGRRLLRLSRPFLKKPLEVARSLCKMVCNMLSFFSLELLLHSTIEGEAGALYKESQCLTWPLQKLQRLQCVSCFSFFSAQLIRLSFMKLVVISL